MYVEVALCAQGLCGRALGAIRPDSGTECLSSEWHGVVYMGHWSFVAAFTCTLGSFQGCSSRGKTASTLPVPWHERFEVNRPVACVW